MNWYYVENGQKAGPIDEAQLEELRRAGRIQPNTLVWREGMANWAPFSQVQGDLKPSFSLKLDSGPAASAPVGAGPEAVCTECNRIYPTASMIRYGEAHVCASCKPIFLQKLAEGARISSGGTGQYAGFWIRFAATFVDRLILGAVGFVLGLVMGGTSSLMAGNSPGAAIGMQVVLMAISLAISIGYETFMIGHFGATLGKMACKIQVVTAEGGQVSYLRAFGRFFAKILSYLTCFIGFIIVGFDDQKRGLHDHICSTRVIYK